MAVFPSMTRAATAIWFLLLLFFIPLASVAETDTCSAEDESCKEKEMPGSYVADCRDEDARCQEWAEAGFCDSKPETTLIICRKSCPDVCDDGTIDWGVPQVALDDETKYEVAQTLEYLHTVVYAEPDYESVRHNCKNLNAECASWASQGECDNNPLYMTTNCAASCQTCMDVNKRCPWDPTQSLALEPGDLNKMFERLTTDPTYAKYSPTVLSKPSLNLNEDGPWVVTLDNFVSEQECDKLIQAGATQGYFRSEGGAGESDNGEYLSSVSDYRTSYQAWCLDECYEDPVSIAVSERIANITGVPEKHSEYLQLLKYDVGQYYKVHHDYIPIHVRRPMGPRVLTVFLYLNEPEEGGGTNFPDLGDLTVMPKKGRALIWPSVLNENPMEIDDRTEHEALPVTKGEKYGANAWLHLGDFKDAYNKDCSSR